MLLYSIMLAAIALKTTAALASTDDSKLTLPEFAQLSERDDLTSEDLDPNRKEHCTIIENNRASKNGREHNNVQFLLNNNIKLDYHIWPNGIVPYQFGRSVNKKIRQLFMKAKMRLEKYTCIKLIPRTLKHKNYVEVVYQAEGCESYLGMVGGKQTINIGSDCSIRGTVQHEILHALGFSHEQNRSDRKDFVKIHYDNIPNDKDIRKNFDISSWNLMGVEYDYHSIMHYPRVSFAIDESKPTIEPLIGNPLIGQRVDFSKKDIIRVNKLYQCSAEYDTGAKGCKDSLSDCYEWAENGHCHGPYPYFQYVRATCEKSCNICQRNMTATTQEPTSAIPVDVQCGNFLPDCPKFSKYCIFKKDSLLSSYIRKKCPLECGLCKIEPSPREGCFDDLISCNEKWCKYPIYKDMCKQTCNMCDDRQFDG